MRYVPLLALAACVQVNVLPGHVTPGPLTLPLELPRYEAGDCGLEVAAAALAYHGFAANPDELRARLRQAGGTPAPALIEYLRGRGLEVALVDGSLDQLRRSVDAGRPVIILVALPGGLAHFLIVGAAAAEGIACAHYDGSRLDLTPGQLRAIWAPMDHLAVEVGPDRLAPLEADCRRRIESDPCDGEALNNLAAILVHRGRELDEARRLAERAVSALAEDSAKLGMALGTLGEAWLAMGEPRRAIEAFERSLPLVPEDLKAKRQRRIAECRKRLGMQD